VSNVAVEKNAPLMQRKEECARGTGQNQVSNYAAVKDVQIKLRREECALGMELSSNDAAVMDARIKSSKEECALSMGQSAKYAAAKDVRIKSSKEDYVGGTGHIAIHTMDLLHLDQNTMRPPQLKLVDLELPSEDKKEEAFPER
jgi:hypothetical protein